MQTLIKFALGLAKKILAHPATGRGAWCRHLLLRSTAALLISCVIAPTVSGEDSSPVKLPPRIRAALAENASFFSGAHIKGQRDRRFLADAKTVLRALKTVVTEDDFTQSLRFELRFKGPLFRESIEYLPADNVYTRDAIYEISYDGTRFMLGYKRLKDPAFLSNVQIFTPAIATEYGKLQGDADSLAHMKFWYLHETGFTGPQTMASLGRPVASAILEAAARGQIVSLRDAPDGNKELVEVVIRAPEPWQSRSTFDIETHEPFTSLKNGTDAMQMRIEKERRQLAGKQRLIRFWLNRTLGYAVVEKWEMREHTGETMFHTKNSDFVKVTGGNVWLPNRSVVESFADLTAPLYVSPRPLYETSIRIDQCTSATFDDDAFRIWYAEPGVVVTDWTSRKATLQEPDQYQVPASPDDSPKPSSS